MPGRLSRFAPALRVIAGRGAARGFIQLATVVLLPAWGAAEFGPFVAALGTSGWLIYLVAGAEKAALERFSQGLAHEVYQYGISVTCVSPSQIVPTPGTVFHKLVSGMDDPRGEPPELMAKAVLLLATEPLDKVTGRVTYSQEILKEFGWITEAKGRGVDPALPTSGYSRR